MKYPTPLIEASLIRRYKRFLADVVLDDGSEITVHCPNTGAMTACAEPGSRVWLWDSANPKRKCRYSWEWTTVQGQFKACVNSARANQLVAEALTQRLQEHTPQSLPGLPAFERIQREPQVSDGRLDFLLTAAHQPDHYVEVKSVTLPMGNNQGIAAFPDTVTERGLKHVQRLQTLVEQGHRASLFFCVSLEGIHTVQPAWRIDPAYSMALKTAVKAGVMVHAYGAEFGDSELRLNSQQPLTVNVQED